MSSYTITIAPDDPRKATTTLRVEVRDARVQITELLVRGGTDGLTARQLPAVDLDQLLRAVTPATMPPAVAAAPAAGDTGRIEDSGGSQMSPVDGDRAAPPGQTSPDDPPARPAATTEPVVEPLRTDVPQAEGGPVSPEEAGPPAAPPTVTADATTGPVQRAAAGRKATTPRKTTSTKRGAAKATSAQASPRKKTSTARKSGAAERSGATKKTGASRTSTARTNTTTTSTRKRASAAKTSTATKNAARRSATATRAGATGATGGTATARRTAAAGAGTQTTRSYRRAPADLAEVLRQADSAAAVADHYGVPRYTAQSWIRTLRRKAGATVE